ncbi:MAG: AMP-binding protein, partial [Actinomycetes bacterium]
MTAGVEVGDRVAIWAPNSLAWIVGMLALSSAGGVLVPLNTRFKGAEAADILRRSRARVLLTVRSFLGRDYTAMLAGADLPELRLSVTIDDGGWEGLTHARAAVGMVAERLRTLGADSPLDLMFTSGTTGRPKGVASSHGATVRAYRHYAATLGIRPGDRYLLVNPLFHSFGSKAGLVAALAARATLYPVATFDPAGAAELIAREAITVLPGPPTIYQSLLDLPADVRATLTSLRLAVTGAAAVPVELLARMRAELGFETVLTAYGLTEAGGLVTMCDPGDPPEVVSRTSGRAVPGVEVRITGPGGVAVATGEPGEVEVRGYPVMDGYLDDPVATADAITADGWLRTGDIGVLDEDGGLRITDRKKDLFIVGGFNAYPAEIENTLLGHPGLSRVAVVGVPDARLGEVGEAFV